MLPCAVCQALRIISFTVTQLPGPNYHCRGGEATAVREMPEQWWGHVVVDIRRQVSGLQLLHVGQGISAVSSTTSPLQSRADSAAAVWLLIQRTPSCLADSALNAADLQWARIS